MYVFKRYFVAKNKRRIFAHYQFLIWRRLALGRFVIFGLVLYSFENSHYLMPKDHTFNKKYHKVHRSSFLPFAIF